MYFINSQYLKYIFSGFLFTVLGPLVFLIATQFFSNLLAILISEILNHTLRYFSYKYFIFSRFNTTPRTYIISIFPNFLFNTCLVVFLSDFLEPKFIAILMAIFSASFGYLWSVFTLKK